MPSKIVSAAANCLMQAAAGVLAQALSQILQHERLNCAHFLHACLNYVVQAQKSCLVVPAVDQAFPKDLLRCGPFCPQRLLKEHTPVEKTQVEGEEARWLAALDRWGVESGEPAGEYFWSSRAPLPF